MTDGCVHLLYNSSCKFYKFYQLTSGQLLSGRNGKGRRYGPSITYKITPAGSHSSTQPGGPPCWASTLAFGLTECYNLCSYTFISLTAQYHMFSRYWSVVRNKNYYLVHRWAFVRKNYIHQIAVIVTPVGLLRAGAIDKVFTWRRPARPPATSWKPPCRCPSQNVYREKTCRTSSHQLNSSLQVPFTKCLPGEDLQNLQPPIELLLAVALHKMFTWRRPAEPPATSWTPPCRCPSQSVYLEKTCRTSSHQLKTSLQVPFTKCLPVKDLQNLQPPVELLLAGALHKMFTWRRPAEPPATSWTPPCRCPSQSVYLGKICRTSSHQLNSS